MFVILTSTTPVRQQIHGYRLCIHEHYVFRGEWLVHVKFCISEHYNGEWPFHGAFES